MRFSSKAQCSVVVLVSALSVSISAYAARPGIVRPGSQKVAPAPLPKGLINPIDNQETEHYVCRNLAGGPFGPPERFDPDTPKGVGPVALEPGGITITIASKIGEPPIEPAQIPNVLMASRSPESQPPEEYRLVLVNSELCCWEVRDRGISKLFKSCKRVDRYGYVPVGDLT